MTHTPATARAAILADMPRLIDLAAAVFATRARAEVLREEIDGYQAAILASRVWMTEPLTCRGEDVPARRITEPGDAWLMDDASHREYLAILDARVREAGHDPPPEFCPALMAEEEQRQAERALVDATAPAFGVTGDQIRRNLDRHGEWVENMLGLVACLSRERAA